MKKIISLILATILFIPTIVKAADCDISKIYIDSIETNNTSGYVTELEKATANDKTVNLNLKMVNPDDEIIYKLTLKNDSEEDYEINKNSINLSSDYIDYSLESDENNIVKANSEKTIYLKVKYSKAVDPTSFVNGIYKDNITMKVNLQTDDVIPNPKTGMNYLLISLLIILFIVTLIIYRKSKYSKVLSIIVLSLLIIPLYADALCKCEIELNSTVTITNTKKYKINFVECDKTTTKEFEYDNNMTWREYFQSPQYTELLNSDNHTYIVKNTNFEGQYSTRIRFNPNECDIDDNECMEEYERLQEEVSIDDKILPLEQGFYQIGDEVC